MDFTQPQIMANTWNAQGGYYTTEDLMRPIYNKGNANKQTIRNLFLNGRDKRTFVVKGNSLNQNIDYAEVYRKIRKFAEKKAEVAFDSPWHSIANYSSDILLDSILTNERIKTQGVVDSYLEKEKLDNLVYLISRTVLNNAISGAENMIQRRIIKQIVENTVPTSPKLSKQIVQLQKVLNANEEIDFSIQQRDDLLSVFSVVQSFLPKQVESWKITLSVDPIDFITASLNSYGWSSCNTPNGLYSAMPLALYQDAYTVVAYIESEKSQFVAFNYKSDGVECKHVCSDKKMRRYVYFNENYSGALIDHTYPSQNSGFDEVMFEIFKQFGMENNILDKQEKHDYAYAEFHSSHMVYKDVDFDLNFLVGDMDPEWAIGVDIPCLYCGGEISLSEISDTLNGKGLCRGCCIHLEVSKEDKWW